MTEIIASMSVSLDGFVAGPNHDITHVFAWHQTGEVEIPAPAAPRSFMLGPKNAAYLRSIIDGCGAILSGRALFDMTNGWGGTHPMGVPLVVYSRDVPEGWEDSDVVFRDTIEGAAAAAKEIAGAGKYVGASGTRTVANLLNAGLLDRIDMNVVPVLLGSGNRYFDGLTTAPIALDEREIIEGEGVTHVRYRVRGPISAG